MYFCVDTAKILNNPFFNVVDLLQRYFLSFFGGGWGSGLFYIVNPTKELGRYIFAVFKLGGNIQTRQIVKEYNFYTFTCFLLVAPTLCDIHVFIYTS